MCDTAVQGPMEPLLNGNCTNADNDSADTPSTSELVDSLLTKMAATTEPDIENEKTTVLRSDNENSSDVVIAENGEESNSSTSEKTDSQSTDEDLFVKPSVEYIELSSPPELTDSEVEEAATAPLSRTECGDVQEDGVNTADTGIYDGASMAVISFSPDDDPKRREDNESAKVDTAEADCANIEPVIAKGAVEGSNEIAQTEKDTHGDVGNAELTPKVEPPQSELNSGEEITSDIKNGIVKTPEEFIKKESEMIETGIRSKEGTSNVDAGTISIEGIAEAKTEPKMSEERVAMEANKDKMSEENGKEKTSEENSSKEPGPMETDVKPMEDSDVDLGKISIEGIAETRTEPKTPVEEVDIDANEEQKLDNLDENLQTEKVEDFTDGIAGLGKEGGKENQAPKSPNLDSDANDSKMSETEAISENKNKRCADDEGDKEAESSKRARLEEVAARLELIDQDDEDADDPDEMDTGGDDSTATVSDSTADGNNDDDDDDMATSSCPSPITDTLTAALVPALRALRRGTLSHLTKSELEEIIVQKVCESITERCTEVGELRRRCQMLEEENERYKEIANGCKKQVRELDIVMQKFLTEAQNQVALAAQRNVITPIRVTRSVGLQVSLGPKSGAKAGTSTKTSPIKPSGLNASPNRQVATRPAIPAAPSILNGQTRPMIRPKPACQMMAPPPVPQARTPIRAKGLSGPKRIQQRTPPLATPSKSTTEEIDLTEEPLAARRSPVSSPKQQARYVLPNIAGGVTKYFIAGTHARPPGNILVKTSSLQRTLQKRLTPTGILKSDKHPAPLPMIPHSQPHHPSWKLRPPRPSLRISNTPEGIVLSWKMDVNLADYEKIQSYQLFAYQQGTNDPISTLWRQVGEDVKALPLPMACTLSSFVPGHRYHFSVRAVDVHKRVGPFSYPGSIILSK